MKFVTSQLEYNSATQNTILDYKVKVSINQRAQYSRRAMKIYLTSYLYKPGQISNPDLVEAIGRLLLST